MFLPGAETSAELPTWFDAAWKAVTKDEFKVLKATAAQHLKVHDEDEAISIGAHLEAADGRRLFVIFSAVKAGGRIEPFWFQAGDAELLLQNLPAVEALLDSLSFEKPAPAPSRPMPARRDPVSGSPMPRKGSAKMSKADDGLRDAVHEKQASARKSAGAPEAPPTLKAVYWRTKTSYAPTWTLGGMSYQVQVDIYYIALDGNGRCQLGVVRGATGANVLKGEGTYRISGTDVLFVWSDDTTTVGRFSADRQQLELNGEVFQAGRN
jgi:hypothetical protein